MRKPRAPAWKVLRAQREDQRATKPRLAVVVDRVDEPWPIWVAKRANGTVVKLCAEHLMRDVTLSDAAPAAEGSCAFCSEPVSPTRHAVERWLSRVGGASATEAGMAILNFCAHAYTPDPAPAWVGHLRDEGELLMNIRYDGVCLVKRRGTRGGGFATSIISTVLTSAGKTP